MLPVIEWVLTNYPETRDSDKELIIQVLNCKGARLSDTQKNIMREINFETIRRLRQKLQESGKYLPSERVSKHRKLRSMIVQQNIPTTKPENIQRVLEWGQ